MSIAKMSYEEFKDVVVKSFMNYMPEQYRDMEMHIHTINQINRTADGLYILGGMTEKNISPTIYINDMYSHYLECNDVQETIRDAVEVMVKEMQDVNNKIGKLNIAAMRDNIVFQLVNTEQNRAMLEEAPHREFMDLSIIYRWIIKMDKDGFQSVIIKNSMADVLGFTEEYLFRLAVKNTRKLLPPVVTPMKDMLCRLLIGMGMPHNIAKAAAEEMSDSEIKLWIISNEYDFNGANVILYEDKLHELAMEFTDDLYIMPSSVHEVIITRASQVDPYFLAGMVADINQEKVLPSERLSNQVYHYDKDLRKITLATDTPNKKLC